MNALKIILVIATLQLSAANAALQSIHWKNEGDNLVTLDTDTGIEWLDLTITRGKSLKEISSLLSGEYTGWRLPTVAEMRTLMFATHGHSINNDMEYVNSKAASSESVLRHRLLGVTESQTTSGYYAGAGGVYAFLSVGNYLNTGGYFYFNHYRGTDINYKTEGAGIYLVSDGGASWSSLSDPTININNPNSPINQQPATPVSAPLAFSATMLLLLAFGHCRRRTVRCAL